MEGQGTVADEERIYDVFFVGPEDTRNVEINRASKTEREVIELFLKLSKMKKIGPFACKTLLLMRAFEIEMLSSAPVPYRSEATDVITGQPMDSLWKSSTRYDNYEGDVILGCNNEDCNIPTGNCERDHPSQCYYLYRIPMEHALKYLNAMMETENAVYANSFRAHMGFT